MTHLIREPHPRASSASLIREPHPFEDNSGTFLYLLHAGTILAQYSPCDTPPPTPQELAIMQAQSSALSITSPTGSAPFIWRIPVRITLLRKTDGTGLSPSYNEAFFDQSLSNMNAELAGGTNANVFNFFRCGPIVYIDSDQLHNGTLEPSAYSYNKNFLNVYVSKTPGLSSANFPWSPEPRFVRMTQDIVGTSDATFFHELGHTLGLLHTYLPGSQYQVPVAINPNDQVDHPERFGGREVVITAADPNKRFQPNGTTAGDYVADTPPGCDQKPAQASAFPSGDGILPGCWDLDPMTLCSTFCTDSPSAGTPCLSGCTFNFANCTYNGTYRDYNGDPLNDPNNIIAKNYMSDTGVCRSDFTPGQIVRADLFAQNQLFPYYQPDGCESILDRVEIEGSTKGLARVNIRITPSDDFLAADYTQTISNSDGGFSGKLVDPTVFNNTVKADIKRYMKTDITKLDDSWLGGVSTLDLVAISRHILGFEILNGYKMIAADANLSNTVTTFDIVEFRKLIIGVNTKLPVPTSPWRFIPERVTINLPAGTVANDFDGLPNPGPAGIIDNPFEIIDPSAFNTNQGLGSPTLYCSPDWIFTMAKASGRNGFDAVKLGNIFGSVDDVFVDGLVTGDCPGDITLLVPPVSVKSGDEIELSLKGYKFTSLAAFQLGINASSDDFEYVSSHTAAISDMTIENSFGGLNLGKDHIKVVWLSDNLTSKTLAEGSSLFSMTLKAKKDIANLNSAIYLDNTILESYFLTATGGCKSDASIEFAVTTKDESTDRSGGDNNGSLLPNDRTKKIHCLPNPATDRLTVLFDADTDFESRILIYDMQGKLVQSIEYNFVTGRNVIDLNDLNRLPSGMLNISIFDGKGVHSARVEKQ